MAVGILVPGSVILWQMTRKAVLVDEPIVLTPHHLKREFKLNYTNYYDIEIDCKKVLPFDTIQCLLGLHDWYAGFPGAPNCAGTPAALEVAWKLTSNGELVKEGSTPNILGGAYYNDSVGAELVSFLGKAGKEYQLDLDVLQNGPRLAATRPRLRVQLDGFGNEDLIVTDFLSMVFGAFCEVLGGALILVAFVRRRRAGK